MFQSGQIVDDARGQPLDDVDLVDVLTALPEGAVEDLDEPITLAHRLGKLGRLVGVERADPGRTLNLGDLDAIGVQNEIQPTRNGRFVGGGWGRWLGRGPLKCLWPELVGLPIDVNIELCLQADFLKKPHVAPRTNEVVGDGYGNCHALRYPPVQGTYCHHIHGHPHFVRMFGAKLGGKLARGHPLAKWRRLPDSAGARGEV
jgi:hypothetical protein